MNIKIEKKILSSRDLISGAVYKYNFEKEGLEVYGMMMTMEDGEYVLAGFDGNVYHFDDSLFDYGGFEEVLSGPYDCDVVIKV